MNKTEITRIYEFSRFILNFFNEITVFHNDNNGRHKLLLPKPIHLNGFKSFHQPSSHINMGATVISKYVCKRTLNKLKERKVTLMQLENENEAAMLRQFKENQNKQNPFLYITKNFETKLNFSLPLRKKRHLQHFKAPGTHFTNREIISNTHENYENIDKYFKRFLNDEPKISEGSEESAAYGLNAEDKSEFPIIKNYDLDYHGDNLANMASSTFHVPLNFSDAYAWKILSQNIPLRRIQQMKEDKLKEEQQNVQSCLKNSNTKYYKDLFRLLTLYKALQVQSYLDNYLNSEQRNSNKDILNKIVYDKTYGNVQYPVFRVPHPVSQKKETFEVSPNVWRIINRAVGMTNFSSSIKPELIPLSRSSNSSSRKCNPFLIASADNQHKTRSSGKETDRLQQNYTMLNEGTKSRYFPEDPNLTNNQNNLIENNTTLKGGFKPFDKIKSDKFFINKINNNLKYLSNEDKLNLYNDLHNITDYLQQLLAFEKVPEYMSDNTDILEHDSKELCPLFRQNNFNKDTVSNYTDDEVSNLNDCLTNPKLGNNDKKGHVSKNLKQHNFLRELFNRLMTKLNSDQIEYSPDGSDDTKREIQTKPLNKNQYPRKETNNLAYCKEELINTNKRNVLSHFHENCRDTSLGMLSDSQRFDCNDQLAELLGALTFEYPIPEDRKCSSTSTPKPDYLMPYPPCKYERDEGRNKLHSPLKKSMFYEEQDPFNYIGHKLTKRFSDSGIHSKKLNPKRESSEGQKKMVVIKSGDPYALKQILEFLNSQQGTERTSIPSQTVDNAPMSIHKDIHMQKFNKKINVTCELLKELETVRNRNTTGCYYIYKDYPSTAKGSNRCST